MGIFKKRKPHVFVKIPYLNIIYDYLEMKYTDPNAISSDRTWHAERMFHKVFKEFNGDHMSCIGYDLINEYYKEPMCVVVPADDFYAMQEVIVNMKHVLNDYNVPNDVDKMVQIIKILNRFRYDCDVRGQIWRNMFLENNVNK